MCGLALIACVGCSRPRRTHFGVAYWFWNNDVSMSPAAQKSLHDMGTQAIFVRAATFSNDGEQYVPTQPVTFKSRLPLPIHLVINFDSGAIRHFESEPTPRMVRAICDAYRSSKTRATAVGNQVVGLQLDLDCPTRLLLHYAEVLRAVRKELPKEQLSITGLTTWIGRSALRDVVAPLDFFAPQFYEAAVPSSIHDDAPIATLAGLAEDLDKLDDLGKPYWVGTPAYGQALIYRDDGRLMGTYRGMSLGDASRIGFMTLDARTRVNDEWHYRFSGTSVQQATRGERFHLVYRLPTAKLVAQFSDIVRKHGSANCLGIAVFRVPEESESMALDLNSVAAELAGKPLSPSIRIRTGQRSSPWSLIERGDDGPTNTNTWVRLENTGAATLAGPDAFNVVLRFPPASLEEVYQGSFDVAQLFAGSPSAPGVVSKARASGIIAKVGYLGAGGQLDLGPLVFKGKPKVSVEWSALGQDNVRVSGSLTLGSGQ